MAENNYEQDLQYLSEPFGEPCCTCGRDCSGLGKCDICKGVLCFPCANFEGEKTVLCDNCKKDKEVPNGRI